MKKTPTACIIVIGNEILSGKITDLNSNFLIQELRKLGVEVQSVFILPDHDETITAVVKRVAKLFDHVFTTGGIGPTHDDITMHAVARGLGLCLKRSVEYEKLLADFFGKSTDEYILKMSEIPETSELIYTNKTAMPLVKVKNFFIFPGDPNLFKKQFLTIRDKLKAEPFHEKKIYITLQEEEIVAILEQADRFSGEVQVGSYPDYQHKDYKVLVTIESKDPKMNQEVADFIFERIPKQFIFHPKA